MHSVGKIDVTHFQQFFPEAQTEEVIITEEQIQHIEERHPGDFARFGKYIPDILEHYQLMLRDKFPNTAILLAQIAAENGERVQLILRLHVKGDHPLYKNSVISMWKIDEERWRTYSRSKKIIDKRE